jgi:hypothetical protein
MFASNVCGSHPWAVMMMFWPAVKPAGIGLPRSFGSVVVGSGAPIDPVPNCTFIGALSAEWADSPPFVAEE